MLLCLGWSLPSAYAQALPPVFELGKNEQAYDKLSQEYARTLLAVSDNDMKKALNNWLELVKSIQDYASAIQFNINGLKVWLHVFWREDGAIDHLGYFLLPDSRFIKPEELNAFFASFVRQYQGTLQSDRKFSHYTSATFPTFVNKKP